MSAYWKIPLQALVLLVGVGVFVYYQFVRPPLLYNPAHEAAVVAARGAEYDDLQRRYAEAFTLREEAALAVVDASGSSQQPMDLFLAREQRIQELRGEALTMVVEETNESSTDVNYIIPRFVLSELPIGLAGLFIAGVFAAAMSSIAAELNALSTASVIDFYRRWIKPHADDAHYLTVSKGATVFWGFFACIVATYAATLGSLIEVVNRFGSFFYGSILGVFLLAMVPMAKARGAFLGLIIGMATVAYVASQTSIEYLWQNVIGAGVVLAVGVPLSLVDQSEA